MKDSTDEILFTPDDLQKALEQNREIEFSLNEHHFFAEPCTDYPLPTCYKIWDVAESKWIFQGGIDDFWSFQFLGIYSLSDYFKEFEFQYIL